MAEFVPAPVSNSGGSASVAFLRLHAYGQQCQVPDVREQKAMETGPGNQWPITLSMHVYSMYTQCLASSQAYKAKGQSTAGV
jgi:hypothetical protein